MSGEVLFLAHRIPFPPDRGDKIRSHHVLKAIARLAPIHVACLADDPSDLAHEAELAALSASHCLVRRAKPLVLAGIEALAKGLPVSLAAFHNQRLARYVDRVLADRPIAAIFVFSGQMGQYVPETWSGRLVTDFVDVDSAKFEAYAAENNGPRAWIDAREARLLAREESRLAERSDVSLLVSESEADLFRSRLPHGSPAVVRSMGNGIDAAAFDPARIEPAPAMLADAGPRLIFTGQMDYSPNVAAVRRAADAILPRIRAKHPGTTLHVVGRNPPAALRALDGHGDGQSGVRIWGAVPDIRPWLAAADLALVPLAIARGVQNKVLEAMAMALPAVLTQGAATGIAAQAGRDFMVADDDEALAESAAMLLGDRGRATAMGEAARRFVLDHADWSAALAGLAAHLGITVPARRDAA